MIQKSVSEQETREIYMNFERVLVPWSLNCQMDFLYVSDIVRWRAQMIPDSVLVAMNIFLTFHGVLFHLYVLRMLKIQLTYLDP